MNDQRIIWVVGYDLVENVSMTSFDLNPREDKYVS